MNFLRKRLSTVKIGHSVSSKGMWPSRNNLKAIAKYPEPMMYTAIKGFIGLMGTTGALLRTLQKSQTLCMNMGGVTQPRKRKSR